MRYLLSILLMMSLLTVKGQTTPKKESDSTEVSLGKKKIQINSDSDRVNISILKGEDEDGSGEDEDEDKPKKVDTDFFGLDMGVNMPLVDGSPNLPEELNPLEVNVSRSPHVGMYFFPTTFSLYKNKINLKTALNLDVVDYGFRNRTTLLPQTTNVDWINDSVAFKKNKLKPLYLQIPLLLNFETNKKHSKSFHLSLGGYAGLMIDSRTKQKSQERGKVVVEDDFNLNKFRYGVSARIGYGFFTLYVNYSLSSLFRKDLVPEIYPLTVGLNILNW